jgi:hypothetical protein
MTHNAAEFKKAIETVTRIVMDLLEDPSKVDLLVVLETTTFFQELAPMKDWAPHEVFLVYAAIKFHTESWKHIITKMRSDDLT